MNSVRLLLSATAVVLLAVASSPFLTKFQPYFFTRTRTTPPKHDLVAPRGRQSGASGVEFCVGSSGEAVDLLVINGSIYTSDAAVPFADSMAIRGGRILRIGNYSSMEDLVGYATKTLNLQGKQVVPGFIDSHVHLIFGGLQMAQVQLRGVNSKDHFVNKVKEALSTMQPGS